ncbi:HTH domain-containing protein [bacterium]|nr:HTH domain-containing protein [bacterium]
MSKIVFRKSYDFYEKDKERILRIQEGIEKLKLYSHCYEKDIFLDAMEFYLENVNYFDGGDTSHNSKHLREEYSNLKSKLHDHASIRREKLIRIINERKRPFGREWIIKVHRQEFGVSHQTIYNDIAYLEATGVIKPAPRHEAEKYNREHRKKGMREIKVYISKNYEPEQPEISSSDEDIDILGKYLQAKPIKPCVSVSVEG